MMTHHPSTSGSVKGVLQTAVLGASFVEALTEHLVHAESCSTI